MYVLYVYVCVCVCVFQEENHVRAGVEWFTYLCSKQGVEPGPEFRRLVESVSRTSRHVCLRHKSCISHVHATRGYMYICDPL